MIEGAPIGMSFTFHDTYYRSHDSTYGKVSMCGLAGAVWSKPREIDALAVAGSMQDAIRPVVGQTSRGH